MCDPGQLGALFLEFAPGGLQFSLALAEVRERITTDERIEMVAQQFLVDAHAAGQRRALEFSARARKIDGYARAAVSAGVVGQEAQKSRDALRALPELRCSFGQQHFQCVRGTFAHGNSWHYDRR